MTAIVPGIYRNGKIELLEAPSGIREGNVTVAVTEQSLHPVVHEMLQRGKYKGGRMSTEADFEIARFQGDKKFADL